MCHIEPTGVPKWESRVKVFEQFVICNQWPMMVDEVLCYSIGAYLPLRQNLQTYKWKGQRARFFSVHLNLN
jgi:hypothetical protein